MAMTIDALAAEFDREIAALRDAARREGGWMSAMSRLQSSAQLQPPVRFPTVQEVRDAVKGLAHRCAVALERMQASVPPAMALLLWQRLTRATDEEGRAHQEFLRMQKPRSKLLGDILANATASVEDEFWTAFKWDERVVAMCRSCGAPQQKARDFKCCYCGGDLYRGPDDIGGNE